MQLVETGALHSVFQAEPTIGKIDEEVPPALHEKSTRMQIMRARNEERRHIARELHDMTAQLLLELEFAIDRIGQRNKFVAGMDARKIIARLQNQMRCLAYILHPPELERYGLLGALEALTLGMSARTGIAISFHTRGYRGTMYPELEFAVLRIAQEALMNVLKHSGSERAEVRLYCGCNWLCLRVRDFGIGARARGAIKAGSGVGVSAMAERMEEVGGKVRITMFDRGTAVSAVFRGPNGICPEFDVPECPAIVRAIPLTAR